ncbi:MAG: GNAT family N-acetyltransferase [Chlorobi bacterium]|nr:GNAT family N-acetyltransferase [Chlorobiota bacterium]
MELQTAHLLLRPYSVADIAPLHRLWTNEGVRRYLWDGAVVPLERAAQVVRSSIEEWEIYGFGQWCVCDCHSGELIGFCGFRRDEPGMPPELIYGLHPDWWGRGLATESARAALAFGFQQKNFSAVWAITDPPNVKSVAVLRRLGMAFQRRGLLHGLETLFYRLTKAEWERENARSLPSPPPTDTQ